jgi:hypothetical protein
MWFMPIIPSTQEAEAGEFKASQGKVGETLSQKQKTNKSAGGMT